MLEAASKQDRAPDTVYSLPFPVIIAPEALTPPNPAEVQVELAEVTEVTEVEEGAEPAKKKAVVPPVYKWHAVVPLVKSEQQEPPEQAAPAAAASEVRGLQLDQGPPRTAMPGTAAPAAGGAGPNPSTLTPGIFEGALGELATSPTADTVFEDILRRRIVQNGHLATVEMKPDPEMAAREKKAEEDSLAATKARLTLTLTLTLSLSLTLALALAGGGQPDCDQGGHGEAKNPNPNLDPIINPNPNPNPAPHPTPRRA